MSPKQTYARCSMVNNTKDIVLLNPKRNPPGAVCHGVAKSQIVCRSCPLKRVLLYGTTLHYVDWNDCTRNFQWHQLTIKDTAAQLSSNKHISLGPKNGYITFDNNTCAEQVHCHSALTVLSRRIDLVALRLDRRDGSS